jgi:hypothetical protein
MIANIALDDALILPHRANPTGLRTTWDPASEEWEVCPCGWRPELGKHYAKAGHVQWWREQIKERGNLEAVYRDIRKRQREYSDRDMG